MSCAGRLGDGLLAGKLGGSHASRKGEVLLESGLWTGGEISLIDTHNIDQPWFRLFTLLIANLIERLQETHWETKCILSFGAGCNKTSCIMIM